MKKILKIKTKMKKRSNLYLKRKRTGRNIVRRKEKTRAKDCLVPKKNRKEI